VASADVAFAVEAAGSEDNVEVSATSAAADVMLLLLLSVDEGASTDVLFEAAGCALVSIGAVLVLDTPSSERDANVLLSTSVVFAEAAGTEVEVVNSALLVAKSASNQEGEEEVDVLEADIGGANAVLKSVLVAITDDEADVPLAEAASVSKTVSSTVSVTVAVSTAAAGGGADGGGIDDEGSGGVDLDSRDEEDDANESEVVLFLYANVASRGN
jgi:hypothetical protein